MSWLTNFVRPKIRALVSGGKEIPDNLWVKCPGCGAMLFHRELDANLRVCSHCQHHLRLPVAERITLLMDPGHERIDWARSPVDPLRFRDQKRYADRLRDAQSRTGETDALRVVSGAIGGHPAVLAAFDFDFMGGSMGMAVGEGLVAAARTAVARGAALIAIPASGGARMQEGILSLMQMPRSTIAVQMVKEAGLPYLVLLTDPTTGGVTASFAMLGDITLSEPGALIGFAGARVIEDLAREKLPEGFQRAEYLHEHGMVDMVVPRAELRGRLSALLSLLMQPAGSAAA